MFSGTGKINIRYISLDIDPSLKPVAQPLRHTPFNLRDKVMHVPGTQDIADPLSRSIDGKADLQNTNTKLNSMFDLWQTLQCREQ